MLVRDIDGKIHIISRKNSNNDKIYYQKIMKIRSEYMKHYKSVIIVSNQNSLSK
jgi:hypothetical protein